MKKFLPLFLVVGVYLLYVLVTYKYYAITSDEFSSYISGQIWLEYFQNKEITYNLARYHPLVNEHYRLYSMILFIFVGSMKYELFHLWNGIVFVLVIISAYFLTGYLKNVTVWKRLVPIFFVLFTPRLLGDIFNNPKDMPFAVFYFISIALIFFQSRQSEKWNIHFKVIILGVLFGFTQSLRPLGFGLYLLYILCNLPLVFDENKKINRTKLVDLMLEVINIALVAFLVMAITWPAIGSNFGANFKKYLSLGVDFNLWEGEILYLGKVYQARELPWHYLLVWVAITLPVSHLVFLMSGAWSVIKKTTCKLQNFLFLVILLNLFLHFTLSPSLYNGIRHYDFLILIMAYTAGVNFLVLIESVNKKARIIILSVTGIYLIWLFYNIFNLFPYTNLYFNETVFGIRGAEKKFDLDYWDTSYKEGAEKLKGFIGAQEKTKIYSCGARTALDYYLGDSITQTKNPDEAVYIMCDPDNFGLLNTKHNILTKVERSGITLVVIGKQ